MKKHQTRRPVRVPIAKLSLHPTPSCLNFGLISEGSVEINSLPIKDFTRVIIDNKVYYIVWYEYFSHDCIIIMDRKSDPTVWIKTSMDVISLHH